MTVATPFVDVSEIERSVSDKSFEYKLRIMSKMKAHVSAVENYKKNYESAVNNMDKFKADLSNLMTEEETKKFCANNGI